ncbi:MarR family winged helix-turn-helix transcriptional regulator [Phytomonospora endophytica]|uniref:DNA-binding MarR family transcriptional regulator n=1 Tax=Phytomonospora endophytica TaxID=714109 RepID=A0A841FM79_9ACTN|nr:MarR family transcriptional regulator [Phytomonospora endophytica]MBB6038421.1 DNA-binding MarR family transcriptional regulator [Phytomonospora endophytica]
MTDDTALWRDVVAVHARVEQRLSTALQRGHGLGLSEYRALAELAPAPKGERRMQELADALGLNQSSVTRLVNRLHDAGFTYRDVCADDRRGVYTVLTDDGRRRHAEARTTYDTTLTEALGELTEDEALGKVMRRLRG